MLGCTSAPASAALSTPKVATATPSAVLLAITSVSFTAAPSIAPTPTEWLSYSPNYSAEGCSEFTATLPIKEAENLSRLEISHKLFEIYLGHYKSPELGGLCRLEEFKVENVQANQRFDFLASEQHVDFVNTVEYSVQVKEAPTGWAAGNGELAADGWIVHKFLIVGVIKVNDEYILKPIGTGP